MRSLLQWLALINDKMLEINGVKDKLAIHPMKFNYFFSQVMLSTFVKEKVVDDRLCYFPMLPLYLLNC